MEIETYRKIGITRERVERVPKPGMNHQHKKVRTGFFFSYGRLEYILCLRKYVGSFIKYLPKVPDRKIRKLSCSQISVNKISNRPLLWPAPHFIFQCFDSG